MKKITFAAALLASAIMSGPASAASLFYSYTPSVTGQPTFSFNIDSNPVPTEVFTNSFRASVQNFARSGSVIPGDTTFEFFTPINGGGLLGDQFNLFGQQLFSGTTAAPTLLTGNFTLFDSNTLTSSLGTLSVTAAVAGAVPEPATWAMMLVGFGGIGFGMRRKSKVTTRVAFA